MPTNFCSCECKRNEIFKVFLLIIKRLQIQAGCQLSRPQIVSSADVLFLILCYKLATQRGFWLLRNAFATNYDVNGYILGRHGLPDTISKMLAVENDEEPSLVIFQTRLLIFHGFTIYTSEYRIYNIYLEYMFQGIECY